MNLRLPIYVCEQGSGNDHRFTLTPLFAPSETEITHADLDRGMQQLQRDLRKEAAALSEELRLSLLQHWAYAPELREEKIPLRVLAGKSAAQAKALAVVWTAAGRKVAMLPAFREIWFEPGEDLAGRAGEVLSRCFRETGEIPTAQIEELAESREWITSIDLEVPVKPGIPREEANPFASLEEGEKLSGQEELERVGRCLDSLYPHGLSRALLREQEVEELQRLLHGAERRAVLLVGPRKSGKTAVVEEMVYRARQRRNGKFSNHQGVWLIAPQRLISGMAYVGQWENRLLAIIEVARKKRHILYFEDILGLLQAGRSAHSDLNAALVLRPFLERREVRILGEITPEALRVLRERDRAFADLFHLVPVRETGEHETLRILCSVAQGLEADGKRRIDPAALPAIYDVTRRFVPESAFPGKAAEFLKYMATAKPNIATAFEVWYHFAQRYGLGSRFAQHRGWPELGHGAEISRQVVGQQTAVDHVCAHLNLAVRGLRDPSRPVAVFLFVGPTGVGKTELAQVLTKHLFGSADNLIRFNMNEFCSADAVPRLAGTFYQPEGLLTNAIRQRPFAVLLLDEIEKADSGVFDLLLQVLGEGRLTDALGRTADFTNAVIIMTSNLGVREAQNKMGFGGDDAKESEKGYLSAVRGFFRPEFFNRLDGVVPFRSLGKEDILSIAHLQLTRLMERHGLSQRRCWLEIAPSAEELVATRGYDSPMGARALKRAIEQVLVQPLAQQLAERAGDVPTILSARAENGRLVTSVAEFSFAAPVRQDIAPPTLDEIERFLSHVEMELEPLRPTGAISVTDPPKEAIFYYAIRDKLDWLQRQIRREQQPANPRGGRRPAMRNINRQAQNPLRRLRFTDARIRQMVRGHLPGRAFLELVSETNPEQETLSTVEHLLADCAVLGSILHHAADLREQRFVVILHESRATGAPELLLEGLAAGFQWMPGASVKVVQGADPIFHENAWITLNSTGWGAFTVTGFGLESIVRNLRGLILGGEPGERVSCLQIEVLETDSSSHIDSAWVEAAEPQLSKIETLEVIRIVSSARMFDLRSGIVSSLESDPGGNYKMLAASLPNPLGFRE